MEGHGEKFTRKQGLAVVELITRSTVKDAAASVGISEGTLWRWMQLPEFRVRYHESRRTVVDTSIAGLQRACDKKGVRLA